MDPNTSPDVVKTEFCYTCIFSSSISSAHSVCRNRLSKLFEICSLKYESTCDKYKLNPKIKAG